MAPRRRSARSSFARSPAAPADWSRRRLQLLLAATFLVAAAVVAGLVWAVIELPVGGTMRTASLNPSNRMRAAAAATAEDPLDAAQPAPVTATRGNTLRVPQPTRLGPAEVGTGFPATPEGALGQLIAIDQRALESVSVVTAQDVIAAWAAPGGPTPATWSGVTGLDDLLSTAGLTGDGSAQLTIRLDPQMGHLAQAGQAVTACVDFVATADTIGSGNASGAGEPSRIAVADCQHLVWRTEALGDAGRWVIAPGAEAAPMPSTWPGTTASYESGWQWLEIEP